LSSLFLFISQADSTDSISASSEALPVENIQNTQRSKPWRSGVGTTSSIQFQLSNPLGADYLALIDCNLTTAGEVRIEAWDDAFDGSTKTLDETFTPTIYQTGEEAAAYGDGDYGVGLYGSNTPLEQLTNQNLTIFPLGSVITSAYYRLTFTDENTSYQQLGRLMLGAATTFTYNLSYGYNLTRVSRSASKESIGGQRYVQKRADRLRIQGEFPFMPDVERTEILRVFQSVSYDQPFVYSIYPEATNKGLSTSMYGRFENADFVEEFFQATNLGFAVLEEL